MVLVASPSMRATKDEKDAAEHAPNRVPERGMTRLPVYSVYDPTIPSYPDQPQSPASTSREAPPPPPPKDFKYAPTNVSDLFCAPDADLVLLSSDDTMYRVHSGNIRTFSSGFPHPSLVSGPGDPVQLAESSHVLTILLQFMRNQRPPDLDSLPFNLLLEVADAIERYRVHQSTTLFQHRMRQSIPHYPFQVLTYASRHNLLDMADEAANQALDVSVRTPLPQTPLYKKALLSFMLYREQFSLLLEFLAQPPPSSKHSRSFTSHKPRDLFTQCYSPILLAIQGHLGLMRARLKDELEKKMEDGCSALKCSTCKKDYLAWKSGLIERIGQIRPFREFIPKVECSTL